MAWEFQKYPKSKNRHLPNTEFIAKHLRVTSHVSERNRHIPSALRMFLIIFIGASKRVATGAGAFILTLKIL